MIDLFKILMEKFQRCLCLDNLKKNENRLKNKNLDIYTFEFLHWTPRTACLSTYKYFCPPRLCWWLRDVSQPFTEEEKIDYSRKSQRFCICYKGITFAFKKQTNRTMYTNRRKRKALSYMPILLRNLGRFYK